MGIEERIDRLIAAGDDIPKALATLNERVAEIARRFSPTVAVVENEPPAKPKRWRRLDPKELVQDGDWMNARSNSQDKDPPYSGWIPAGDHYFGEPASAGLGLYFAREVTDETHQCDQPAGAGEMVAEASEHPAGPMPDPGEGYRILSKDPPEELLPNDEYELAPGGWIKSERARTTRIQDATIWYRRKIEPAEPLPAWEPKVGDWVKVTRPENWGECSAPRWDESMHQFDGKVVQVERELEGRFYIGGFIASNGWQYQFHRDWLSPAAPEEPPKPSEPEYREPVLPGDAGKKCEFSDNGELWDTLKLAGWNDFPVGWHWKSRTARGEVHSWKRCRIRKDS